jgi:hypothetical protein
LICLMLWLHEKQIQIFNITLQHSVAHHLLTYVTVVPSYMQHYLKT